MPGTSTLQIGPSSENCGLGIVNRVAYHTGQRLAVLKPTQHDKTKSWNTIYNLSLCRFLNLRLRIVKPSVHKRMNTTLN